MQRTALAQSRCVSGGCRARLRLDRGGPYARRANSGGDSEARPEHRAILHALRGRVISAGWPFDFRVARNRDHRAAGAAGRSSGGRAVALVPFLIVSDIHANREALEAVLADARGKYDRIVCLGDLAGYGADPNFTVEWARANVAAIVRGNHDKLCAGLESLYSYRPAARAAAEWTLNTLTAENRAYLEKLPRGPLPYEGFDL